MAQRDSLTEYDYICCTDNMGTSTTSNSEPLTVEGGHQLIGVNRRDYAQLRAWVEREGASRSRQGEYRNNQATKWSFVNSLKIANGKHKEDFGTCKPIKLGSYVGIFELPSGRQIEVLPKINLAQSEYEASSSMGNSACRQRERLWDMLRCLPDLEPFRLSRRASVSISSRAGDFLLEQILATFVSEVDWLTRAGLRSSYETLEGNLPYYRGRLLFGEHIRANAAHRERFYVEHDEFSPNSPENQAIKSALDKTIRYAENSATRKTAKRLFARFDGVEPARNARVLFRTLSPSRCQKEYVAALGMARMILLGFSYESARQLPAPALMFDMNTVFERYVTVKLSEYAAKCGPGSRWQVAEQMEVGMRCDLSTANPIVRRPDVVIKAANGNPIAVLDAKWKELHGKNRGPFAPERNDVAQVLQYAALLNVENAVLVYPYRPYPELPQEGFCYKSNYSKMKLHIAFWDLSNEGRSEESAAKLAKLAKLAGE